MRRSAHREALRSIRMRPALYAKGHITVYGRGTGSREKTNEDDGREFQMRHAVIVRTIRALRRRASMLNSLRYGFLRRTAVEPQGRPLPRARAVGRRDAGQRRP